MTDTVLVTGASGFIAQHCIIQLLEAGYDVRGTLRSQNRVQEVRDAISAAIPGGGEKLSFAYVDLMKDEGWDEAMAGCTYLLHVASPFPLAEPKDENEVIRPAVDGALRALQAAARAGVRRTVLTSSLAAVMYGHNGRERPFDEHDWSNLSGDGIGAYVKSKTLAEKAAWDFISTPRNRGMELAVINPGLVLGPVTTPDTSTSMEPLVQMMSGQMPALPRLSFPVVDVRDVAAAHVAAMTEPEAAGKRFCCAVDELWFKDISDIIREPMAAHGIKVPTAVMPDFAVRLFALFRSDLKALLPDLGIERKINNMQIRRVLNWSPRDAEEATLAAAESLVSTGVIKAKP